MTDAPTDKKTGQYPRCTASLEERVERAVHLLGLYPSRLVHIATILRKEFRVHQRAAHEYIARARALVTGKSRRTRDAWLDDVVHRLESLYSDPTATVADKLKAVTLFVNLLGLRRTVPAEQPAEPPLFAPGADE